MTVARYWDSISNETEPVCLLARETTFILDNGSTYKIDNKI